jgi:His-Xaa-Ser system radical SAM maturase HxsB
MISLSKTFYPLDGLQTFKLYPKKDDAYNWGCPAKLLKEGRNESLNIILNEQYNSINSFFSTSSHDSEIPILPVVNYYRSTPIDKDSIFISVDTGNWMILRRDEFLALKSNDIMNPDFYQKLEKNFILLTKHNFDAYINKLRIRYGFLIEGPTLHIVVVTMNCNLQCIYCQVASGINKSGKMTLRTANESVKRIFESPSDSFIIEFQGGEPLMNFPVIENIIEYATDLAKKEKKRVEFSLISNFTDTVDEDKLRFLIAHNVSICFSLDGPKELHERNRGKNYPNSFNILKEKVELYKKIWSEHRSDPPNLKALMTTTAASFPLFREIVDTYLNMGITQLNIRPITPLGRAETFTEDLNYEPDKFVSFWKHVVAYILELRKGGIDISEFFLELILTKLFANESGYMDMRSPCGASYGQIVYNYDGDIYTCDEGRMIRSDRFIIGNVHHQNLKSILTHEKSLHIFKASITEQFYCDYCAFKPYCGICPVLNYQQKGKLYINILESNRCAINFEMIKHVIHLLLNNTEARDEFQKILLNVNWQKVG